MEMNNEKKIRQWNYAHAALLAAALFFNSISLFALLAALSFVVYVVLHKDALSAIRPFGGYANWVTAFRLSLALLLAFSFSYLSPWQIAAAATAVISLDGLDGYLARKFNTQSLFGSYFDMETDAFYVALMSSILYHQEYVGYWILLPGFLRYFYVLFVRAIGFHTRTEKRLKFTQYIAVAFFIALILPFVFPYGIYFPVLAAVSCAILVSFAYSFYSILNYKHEH
jgi:phosphatidylglycerophosphate synthase